MVYNKTDNYSDQLIQNGGFVMNFDFQAYVDSINGMAGIYSFDVFPDGSYSEIRLMSALQSAMYMPQENMIYGI